MDRSGAAMDHRFFLLAWQRGELRAVHGQGAHPFHRLASLFAADPRRGITVPWRPRL